jgi:Alcohol dehydrogenase GroES-like domain
MVVGLVAALGEGVTGYAVGGRVGVAWLRYADGTCAYCRRGNENLCPNSLYTLMTINHPARLIGLERAFQGSKARQRGSVRGTGCWTGWRGPGTCTGATTRGIPRALEEL